MANFKRFAALVGGRAAEAYEDAQVPGVWRVRFELYPEHTEPMSGWYGGQVSLAHGWNRDGAEQVARAWVEDGVRPDEIRQVFQR